MTAARRDFKIRLRAEDYAVRVFVATAILNINNIVFMATGVSQAGSVIMLVACLVVVTRVGGAAWSSPFALFVASIGTYIFFGNIFYNPMLVENSETPYSMQYGSTLIGVWAVAAYTRHVTGSPKLNRFKSFMTAVLLVLVASIYVSPLLLPLWRYQPLASDDLRFSGFFANPNEAGFAASGALIFVALEPKRVIWLRAVLMMFCLGGVVLSFSKTAITVSIVVLTVVLIRSLRGLALYIAPIAAAVLILFVNEPVSVEELLANQSLVELSETQKARILSIGSVLTGEFDDKVTTGRTGLWELGLQRISDRFPAGYGFDAFHHLVGGVYHSAMLGETWLGVHNTPLMLLGEGGVVPFVLFVACIFVVAARLFRIREPLLPALLLVMFLAEANSGHGALELRYENVFFGFLLAAVSVVPPRRVARARPLGF